MKTIYLGLGSNIGDRASNLRAAAGELAAGGVRIRRASPIYETEPVDYTQQRWFLNQVVEADTELFPMQLLSRIGQIERGLGRVRTVPKGPRTIDIDILFYGQAIIHSATLELPHPRMAQRRFVLAPLADLAPSLRHPVTHLTIREMLDRAPAQTLRLAGAGTGA
jgi:2-amino-4-hydroxy-6-hydroxymethyldihydropteridine diphosphokinase